MKYAVITFGCRVNQADSFAIEAELRERGATDAPAEEADVVIVNSCSVTANADQAVRHTVRRVARANPDAQVVVTGCYATRRPDDIRALPNVLTVVDNSRKDQLVGELVSALGSLAGTRFVDGDGPCGAPLEPGVAGRTALSLRVQTGCDETCSYCVIPSTRGTSRSRGFSDVMADIRRAIGAGYKEIWITGVHLGSYGRDLGDGMSLARLIEALAAVEDDVLFRISSLEPMDCTREIVRMVAGSPRIAPHFHLPMQHASDAMLRAMRRPYSAGYYADLLGDIHQSMPHAAIGTDVIVGFPGEDAQHVDELHAAIRTLPFAYVHVFPYSDRPGTAASLLEPKVHGTDVRERGALIRRVAAEKARAFRVAQCGTSRRALTVHDGLSAVTDNYLKVPLPEPVARNQWVSVTL